MIKFSKIDDVIEQKYESKDTLRNQIYDLIDETISIKITNENSIDKDVTINGKEELVEKIKGLIENNRLNERISALEHIKKNVYQNFDMKWLTEQIDTLKINEESLNGQETGPKLMEIGKKNGYAVFGNRTITQQEVTTELKKNPVVFPNNAKGIIGVSDLNNIQVVYAASTDKNLLEPVVNEIKSLSTDQKLVDIKYYTEGLNGIFAVIMFA